jgi:PAP2 superfamily
MRAPETTTDQAPAAEERPRLYWWKEAALIVVFYLIYSSVRNLFGSARVGNGDEPMKAFDNAMRVIRVERDLHLFFEPRWQSAFLSAHWFLWFWNVFYASFHFIVTVVAFIWLFKRAPKRFASWRNTLGFITAFALVGFSLFPLMPPRLLDSGSIYGGATLLQAHGLPPFGFHDTMQEIGGLWNFDSGAMQNVSNQFASMPSLHIAWATWSALALWPLVRRRWARALLVIYPFATFFCIVVTANHYWLDAVGGLVILGAGFLAGHGLEGWNQRRLARRRALAAIPATVKSPPVPAPADQPSL